LPQWAHACTLRRCLPAHHPSRCPCRLVTHHNQLLSGPRDRHIESIGDRQESHLAVSKYCVGSNTREDDDVCLGPVCPWDCDWSTVSTRSQRALQEGVLRFVEGEDHDGRLGGASVAGVEVLHASGDCGGCVRVCETERICVYERARIESERVCVCTREKETQGLYESVRGEGLVGW
jgi:hypothetical protein